MKQYLGTLAVLAVTVTALAVTNAAAAPPKEPAPTCGGQTATVIGTPGDDVLHGTTGADIIAAGAGNDIIYSLDGEDLVCGGSGFDMARGGNGLDLGLSVELCVSLEARNGCVHPDQFARYTAAATAPARCGNEPAEVHTAIDRHFGDIGLTCRMVSIAYRESRWQCGITGGPNRNGTYDRGLLQLNSRYLPTWQADSGIAGNVYDCDTNAAIARHVYNEAVRIWGDGLRPWNATR